MLFALPPVYYIKLRALNLPAYGGASSDTRKLNKIVKFISKMFYSNFTNNIEHRKFLRMFTLNSLDSYSIIFRLFLFRKFSILWKLGTTVNYFQFSKFIQFRIEAVNKLFMYRPIIGRKCFLSILIVCINTNYWELEDDIVVKTQLKSNLFI